MDQGERHICCRSRKVLVGPEDTTMGENVVEVVVNTRIQLPAVSTSESTIRIHPAMFGGIGSRKWNNLKKRTTERWMSSTATCEWPTLLAGSFQQLVFCPIMFKASRRNDRLNPAYPPAYPPVMSNDGKIIELNRGLMTFPLPFLMTGGYCIGNIAVA